MARKSPHQAHHNKRSERIEPKMGDEQRAGLLNLRLGPQDRAATGPDKPASPAKSAGRQNQKKSAAKGASPSAHARTSSKNKTNKPARGRASSSNKPARARALGAKNRRRTNRKASKTGIDLLGLMRGGLYWSAVVSVWGLVAIAGVLAYSAATLPQISTWRIPERPPNVKILDANGALLANRGDTGGEAVRLEQLPPHLIEAVMAIEDRRFKTHFGIDPIGLTRAMVTNIAAGRVVQGGSTLTQQLAKNLFLVPDRTLERKLQEVVLAFWLEANHSKDEILEMYLNRVYFGAGAYGVDAAARRYFNKPARQVTLGEAALLAGLLKAPSRFAPTRNPERSQTRAAVVLTAMAEQGYISPSDAQRARLDPSQVVVRYSSSSTHYAADWVMSQLDTYVTAPDEDIVVRTTIDVDLQLNAEKALRAALVTEGKAKGVTQGAVVMLDRSGAVKAVVGGRDYAQSPFNRATDAKRQPGSAFKPFVYLTAIERGLLPEDIRIDRPVTVRGWTPSNYKDTYMGAISLRTALAKSANTVAVQLASEVGSAQVVKTAERLGIQSELTANPSLALGTSEVTPLELAAAYVPFSNGGRKAAAHVIAEIETVNGRRLYQRPKPQFRAVIDGRSLATMNDMLGAVVAYGTGRRAQLEGHPVGGKTGTSQGSRDAWFVGFSAYYTAAVWLGNDDNRSMVRVTGGTLPAQIWQSFMSYAHQQLPVATLPGNHKTLYASAAAAHLPLPRPRGTARAMPISTGPITTGPISTGPTTLAQTTAGLQTGSRQSAAQVRGLNPSHKVRLPQGLIGEVETAPIADSGPSLLPGQSVGQLNPSQSTRQLSGQEPGQESDQGSDQGPDPVGRFILGLIGRTDG